MCASRNYSLNNIDIEYWPEYWEREGGRQTERETETHTQGPEYLNTYTRTWIIDNPELQAKNPKLNEWYQCIYIVYNSEWAQYNQYSFEDFDYVSFTLAFHAEIPNKCMWHNLTEKYTCLALSNSNCTIIVWCPHGCNNYNGPSQLPPS